MKVHELISALGDLPQDAEVMVEIESDECDVCAGLKRERCSLAGKFVQCAEKPYHDVTSDEVRIGSY
jgi:hypothetical protein